MDRGAWWAAVHGTRLSWYMTDRQGHIYQGLRAWSVGRLFSGHRDSVLQDEKVLEHAGCTSV